MTSIRSLFGVSVLVLVGLLTGCAPAETGLQAEAARQLQAKVMDISQAAAANDTGGALKALDALTADLEAKASRGELLDERKRRISTVIAAVRADLTTVQLSAPAASVTTASDEKPAEPAAPPAGIAPEGAPQPPAEAPMQLDAPVAPALAPIAEPAPAPAPFVISQEAPAPAPAPEPAGNNGNGKGGLGKGQDK